MFGNDGKTLADILEVNASDYKDALVRDISLPNRVQNGLKKSQIRTLEELLSLSLEELSIIRGIGYRAAKELIDVLDKAITNKTIVYTVNTNFEYGETLADLFQIDTDEIKNVSVKKFDFSVRLTNCLINNGIKNLIDLLNTPQFKLDEFWGFGVGCKNELFDFLKSFDIKKQKKEKTFKKTYSAILYEQRDSIIAGRFDEVDVSFFSEKDKKIVDEFKEAYECIDSFIITKCISAPEEIIGLIDCLKQWSRELNESIRIRNLIDNIPERRLHSPANIFLTAFGSECESSLSEMDLRGYVYASINQKEIFDFIKFCQFDLKKEVERWAETALKNERTLQVLRLRAQGKTLQEAGEQFDVTRERIRQIEKKTFASARLWIRQYKIIPKLIADLGGGLTAYSERVENTFGKYGDVICYVLKKLDDEIDTYYFDKTLDLFIFGDNNESVPLKARDFCETLPEQFSDEQYLQFVKEAVDELDIPESLIKEVINDSYIFSPGSYRRKKMRLVDMYRNVLEKYYPDGLWVYGESEIAEFRKHIFEDFGDVKLGSNHAVVSGISRIAILCGRGVYRPKKAQYISNELTKKIERFIDDNPRDTIILNNLYAEFEDELKNEGISNRYYLQGIIRELFGDKYYYRKDILSKTSDMGSASREILRYVHESKTPVTVKEIQLAFPGVTTIMISTALQDPSIIKFFWSYMYVGNIDIYESDKKYLRDKLYTILSDRIPHHDSELFEIIDSDRHDILGRLGILYPYNLYSIAEYLFGDYYNFTRPYIASRDVEINHPLEALNEFVSNTEVFDISELLDMAKQFHYTIPSILDFFDGYNDTHLLMNHDSMAIIDYLGVSKEICGKIEELYEEYSVNKTVPIASLGSAGMYPRINVVWNEWLIYSIIHKWGEKYEVGVIGNSYHNYIPIISRKGLLDKSLVDENFSDEFKTISDFENIDDLLIDIIDDSDLIDL